MSRWITPFCKGPPIAKLSRMKTSALRLWVALSMITASGALPTACVVHENPEPSRAEIRHEEHEERRAEKREDKAERREEEAEHHD